MSTRSKTTRGASSTKKIYCRVCPGWEIKIPERCSNTLVKGGKKHYFCTTRCKERFTKAPEKFA
jgi:YHS domain-containing protein